jgi:hypothetical protein
VKRRTISSGAPFYSVPLCRRRLGGGATLALCGAVCAISSVWAQTVVADAQMRVLDADVEPATEARDALPFYFAGQERRKGGTQFLWYDIWWTLGLANATVKASEPRRLYFDYQDAKNFHFLDCIPRKAFLGICEAGVERILAQAELNEASLRLARHGPWLALFQDGRLRMRAYDERLQGGAVGVRERGEERNLRVVPTEEIHFADDFMRAANEEQDSSAWKKIGCNEETGGYFTIKEVRNPLLSANAFNFMAVGREVKAVTGRETWDQYRVAVSLRGPKEGGIGVVFAYRDEQNYGLFRWRARKTDAQGAVLEEGVRELCVIRDGREECAATTPHGYLPDQWYRVEVWLSYEGLRIFIDGHQVFDHWDSTLCAGAVGLWADVASQKRGAVDPQLLPNKFNTLHALMLEHAVFDDVCVESLCGFEDRFRRSGALSGGWLSGPGVWNVETPKEGAVGCLRPPAEGGKALIGGRRLRTFRLSSAMRLGDEAARFTGEAGLVFLYRDEFNYCTASVSPDALQLTRITEGNVEVMDRVVISAPANAADACERLLVIADRGHVRAVWAGKTAEYFDPDAASRGRVGLFASPALPAKGEKGRVCAVRFASFSLDRPTGVEPLISSNAVFGAERSMGRWAGEDGEWMSVKNAAETGGRSADIRWHCGQFPGDVEVSLEPREILRKDFEVGLSAAKDGRVKDNGYIFRYRSGAANVAEKGKSPKDAENTPQIGLVRQGEEKVNQPAPFADGELTGLALRRCGRYVVGLVNGRPVLTFRDDEPLQGAKLAYYVRGVQVKAEAMQILSAGFMDENFSRAPVEWRFAGGAVIAEIANRWQCDPRWTFFALSNDIKRRAQGKAAVMWSKMRRPGDVTVEFFVGHKMEGDRGQKYAYARDINVTICSDGEDLTKGYTFMFGGMKNAESLILRNERILDRRPVRAATEQGRVHHHWYYIRVEKRTTEDGRARLAYRVDDLFAKEPHGEWVVTDADPLVGDRVALWVYDHAVMISRVRISGADGERESADWRPGTLKTHYDLPGWEAHR